MLLKNITIRARLAVTMALLSVLLCAVGALGLFGMSRANDANEQTSSNQLPSAIDVASAELFAARERLVLDRAALLAGTPDVAPTIERARQMRGVSDSWWKNTSTCRATRRRIASRRTSRRNGRFCSVSSTRPPR